jgi:hypothetical protein
MGHEPAFYGGTRTLFYGSARESVSRLQSESNQSFYYVFLAIVLFAFSHRLYHLLVLLSDERALRLLTGTHIM